MAFEAELVSGSPTMVPYTPSAAVSAGEVVVEGDAPFVAHVDLPANEVGAVSCHGGVYEGDCLNAAAMGVRIWWDNTNNRFTTTSTANPAFGTSVTAMANNRIKVFHNPPPQTA